jgi:hypothetical protein
MEVSVKEGDPPELRPEAPVVFSVFRDDDSRVGTTMICDLAFAAYTGAALAMVPGEEGERALKAQKLPDNLYDNFREVINIVGGTLFNSSETPHLVLREVLLSPPNLKADLKPILTQPGDWYFFDVAIEDYGEGKMILLAAAE